MKQETTFKQHNDKESGCREISKLSGAVWVFQFLHYVVLPTCRNLIKLTGSTCSLPKTDLSHLSLSLHSCGQTCSQQLAAGLPLCYCKIINLIFLLNSLFLMNSWLTCFNALLSLDVFYIYFNKSVFSYLH